MDKYKGLTLKDLQGELRRRGAKISGRKHELVERLEAYDRNQNFGTVPDVTPASWKMDVPDAASYKDLTSESSLSLSPKEVHQYLADHDVKLDKKSQHLYQERFLRYVKSSKVGNDIFLHAQCSAEMKKNVTYEIDIHLQSDGKVNACQCDCTAGLGPAAYCKHVRTLLNGLLDFSQHQRLIVEETCTERLQTFHRPRKLYVGAPVKVQDLGLVDVSTVIFDPMAELEDESEDQFSTRVRNLVIGHSTRHGPHMPILQMYEPANLLAVDIHHDYLSSRVSDLFLEREFITKITKENIAEIEFKTRGQQQNPTWRVERTKRLQSSNYGTICKATERADMGKMALNLMEVKDLSHILSIKHGIDNEDNALRQYEVMTGNAVVKTGILVDEERPYLGTSVDGLCGDKVVEVKCPYAARGKVISHITVPYLKKTPQGLTLDRNHNYYYQIQGQLHITKKSECHFVVYTLVDTKIVRISLDPEFIATMLSKLENFFQRYFKPLYLQKFFYKEFEMYNWKQ